MSLTKQKNIRGAIAKYAMGKKKTPFHPHIDENDLALDIQILIYLAL